MWALHGRDEESVALDVIERWIGRVGAVVGFVTLTTALGWGV
jgi:hypothetical protein